MFEQICYDDKDIIIKTSKRLSIDIIANFENVFFCWDSFGSHHPEKLLKISEVFRRYIYGGV